MKQIFTKIILQIIITMDALCHSNSEELFISLGVRCDTADFLRQKNLRKTAYPFDWMQMSDFNVISNLIENHFADYIERENLVFVKEASEKEGYAHFYEHRIYPGIIINHVFSREKPIEKNYHQFVEVTQRRIDRLYSALNSDKKVIFFRKNYDLCGVERFYNTMVKLYPKLNYFLVVLCPFLNAENLKNASQNLPRSVRGKVCVFYVKNWVEIAHPVFEEFNEVFAYLQRHVGISSCVSEFTHFDEEPN